MQRVSVLACVRHPTFQNVSVRTDGERHDRIRDQIVEYSEAELHKSGTTIASPLPHWTHSDKMLAHHLCQDQEWVPQSGVQCLG